MTLDTNIVIAYLAGEKETVNILSRWKQTGVPLLLPTIVEAEILSFPKFASRELNETESFLEENFLSIPLDRPITRIAAKIRRENSIRLADSIIAACALHTHSPLVTRNVRDFKKIVGLNIITI